MSESKTSTSSSSYKNSRSSTSGEHEYRDLKIHQDTTKMSTKVNNKVIKKSRMPQYADDQKIKQGIIYENAMNKFIQTRSRELSTSPLKPTYMKYLPQYKKTSQRRVVCVDDLCVKTKFINNAKTLHEVMEHIQMNGNHIYPTSLNSPNLLSHTIQNEITGMLLKLQFILLTIFMHNDFNILLVDQHEENILLVENTSPVEFKLDEFIHKTRKIHELCYNQTTKLEKNMAAGNYRMIKSLADDHPNNYLTDYNPYKILSYTDFDHISIPVLTDMSYKTFQPYFYKLFSYLQKISPYKIYFIDSEKMRPNISKYTLDIIRDRDYAHLQEWPIFPYIKNIKQGGIVFSEIASNIIECEMAFTPLVQTPRQYFNIDLEVFIKHIFPFYLLKEIQSWPSQT